MQPSPGLRTFRRQLRTFRIFKNFSVSPLNLTQRKVVCSLLWKLEDNLKSGT